MNTTKDNKYPRKNPLIPSFSKITWGDASKWYTNLDGVNYPENDHRRIRKYGLRRSRLPMSIFTMLCVQLDQSILLVGPRSTLSTESAVHSYIAPVLIPTYNGSDPIFRFLMSYARYLKGGLSINQK